MSRSTYLFAVPNFWSGAASLVDLAGVLVWYNFSRTPAEAEAIATYLDWAAVGDELRSAYCQALSELNESETQQLKQYLEAKLPRGLLEAAELADA